MFKKNKRRDESTFLLMENGEVVTKKEDKKIVARNCDDLSNEELDEISKDVDIEVKNGLPICEPTQDDEEINDDIIKDMKVTIFNIFKFIFMFFLVAIIVFLLIGYIPINESIITTLQLFCSSFISTYLNNIYEKEETYQLKRRMYQLNKKRPSSKTLGL